ncbi:MAG: hypothetical protein COA47_08365 [Robiginitomaculum sp.]|nr:MAG: hypothetical protein COA47_08365 [Robiginitomaculum sp.]
MEILNSLFEIAFQPGDGSVFLIASAFLGLAVGGFSSLWLAVLFALGVDIALPGAVDMLDGYSYASARFDALQRVAHEGGSGLLLRGVGYFVTIAAIILLKKGLGNR